MLRPLKAHDVNVIGNSSSNIVKSGIMRTPIPTRSQENEKHNNSYSDCDDSENDCCNDINSHKDNTELVKLSTYADKIFSIAKEEQLRFKVDCGDGLNEDVWTDTIMHMYKTHKICKMSLQTFFEAVCSFNKVIYQNLDLDYLGTGLSCLWIASKLSESSAPSLESIIDANMEAIINFDIKDWFITKLHYSLHTLNCGSSEDYRKRVISCYRMLFYYIRRVFIDVKLNIEDIKNGSATILDGTENIMSKMNLQKVDSDNILADLEELIEKMKKDICAIKLELLKVEKIIITSLQFRLNPPTSLMFLFRYLDLLNVPEDDHIFAKALCLFSMFTPQHVLYLPEIVSLSCIKLYSRLFDRSYCVSHFYNNPGDEESVESFCEELVFTIKSDKLRHLFQTVRDRGMCMEPFDNAEVGDVFYATLEEVFQDSCVSIDKEDPYYEVYRKIRESY